MFPANIRNVDIHIFSNRYLDKLLQQKVFIPQKLSNFLWVLTMLYIQIYVLINTSFQYIYVYCNTDIWIFLFSSFISFH